MPTPENGKNIEEMYWDRVRKSPPEVRMRRCFSMFHDSYQNMASIFQRENPAMSLREIRIAIAKRLYGGDPRTMKLIEMAENDLNKE